MREKERFLTKVRKVNSCWLWKGKKLSRPPNDYGRFWLSGGFAMAHRASWVLYVGLIPEGMQVLHKCDTPSCVNPEHLFLGTQIDNIKDMCSKGRQSSCKGEKHPKAKLTAEEVAIIKDEIAKTSRVFRGKYSSLAKRYGVTNASIRAIATGTSWA